MNALIWSGAAEASDWFLLAAAIVAVIAAVLDFAARRPLGDAYTADHRRPLPVGPSALLAVAVALIALGLLAV